MYREKMTSTAINAVDRSVPVILNLAAIEQHGPHLPVDTDAVIGAHFLSTLDQIDPQAQASTTTQLQLQQSRSPGNSRSSYLFYCTTGIPSMYR